MSFEQEGKAEGLRRLDRPEARTVGRRDDLAPPVTLIVSVTGIPGTAAPQRFAASMARSIRSALTKGRAASWTSTIKSSVAAGSRPSRTRILPRLAAIGRGEKASRGVARARRCLPRKEPVIRMNHDCGDRCRDARGRPRGFEPGPAALPATVLLRNPFARSRSASCGNDKGGNWHEGRLSVATALLSVRSEWQILVPRGGLSTFPQGPSKMAID